MTTMRFILSLLASTVLASGVVSAIAADLPSPPAGLTAPSKPLRIPEFNLPTPTGGAVRANQFRDKVVIARFWATW